MDEDSLMLHLYDSTVECYEELLGLCQTDGPMNSMQIKLKMNECSRKMQSVINAEDNSGPYVVHLFQLKQHMQTLIKFVKTKESKRLVPDKKSTSSKELDQLVEDALERPRVQGFQDVAGMRDIKGLLLSLIVLPKTQSQLFQNQKLSNSFLLFGPPGTGKTQVVHALAYEANANLYCITAGDLMSSYVGQTEKNVKFLFEYLRKKDSLSLLFIDEIDGFCKKRSESEMDHNRRIKTELLCQISQMDDQSNFFLICATNCPWDLDSAFLRRFHKRLYVPLPNSAERWELFETFIKNAPSKVTFFDNREFLISNTEGWSGSDISDLVQETLNARIVELQYTKIWKKCPDGFYEPLDENGQDYNGNFTYADLKDLPSCSIRARNVETKDIFFAFEHASPTVTKAEVRKFEDFCKV
ncbi:unnamed protein product [Phyllotreta striolata]|uniref:AAA+ ATPase domain-containing protein n=1 Tax=Phyllotreta striolata TaxID=444603 RepID=A0A9N9TFD2_PHYSR|nr:unnamed protein product [Phyllotreta striolata]